MNLLPADFALTQVVLTLALFVWTGFVRTGIGFGGAALGLPLLLMLHDQPLYWLPIIGAHLLFFSGLTLRTRFGNVDWKYLRAASRWIMPTAVVGVLGLINLPNTWLLIFIYSITLFYAVIWMMNWAIESRGGWADRALLAVGGYVAGTSLTGAPLMVAVFMRNVAREQLRDTLFVLWFILVTIKMGTFVAFDVPLHLITALALIPAAAVGHVIGLRAHRAILRNDERFRRVVGVFLATVSLIGLASL